VPVVLIVDDSEMDRRLAGRLLQDDPEMEILFAEDGAKALAVVEKSAPDLVVTDLQMPRMDGLELVTNMRIKHPHVPVVLMTAHGSELVAAQALEQGAASYVPKSQLADKLLETVRNVFSLARADRTYKRLIECSTRSHFEFELENEPALISPLVDLVQQMVSSMGLCAATGQLQIAIALEHALQNAIHHGNLELSVHDMRQPRDQRNVLVERRRIMHPYSRRRVHVKVSITRSEARFVVRDEGPGFDVASVSPQGVGDEQGRRGLFLMRTFMDEVTFHGHGNEVVLVKRKPQTPA
jgi:CheY-like chemotaxis protein